MIEQCSVHFKLFKKSVLIINLKTKSEFICIFTENIYINIFSISSKLFSHLIYYLAMTIYLLQYMIYYITVIEQFKVIYIQISIYIEVILVYQSVIKGILNSFLHNSVIRNDFSRGHETGKYLYQSIGNNKPSKDALVSYPDPAFGSIYSWSINKQFRIQKY